MQYGSIHDAINMLDDVIALFVLLLMIMARMEKHSCFSPEEISKVMSLKKKWDMSAIMQSYIDSY